MIIDAIVGYWVKGGWLMIPLALICLAIWYYLLKMNLTLKKALQITADLDQDLQQSGSAEEWVKRLKRCSAHPAALFQYIIGKVNTGIPLLDLFDEVKQKELTPYERDLTMLKALVVAAPLLGLLGTVLGMIGTFQAIAEKSSETSALMASGISQGLLTTEFGLIIAIPGLFGLTIIKKKMEQWEGLLTAVQFHLAEGLNTK